MARAARALLSKCFSCSLTHTHTKSVNKFLVESGTSGRYRRKRAENYAKVREILHYLSPNQYPMSRRAQFCREICESPCISLSFWAKAPCVIVYKQERWNAPPDLSQNYRICGKDMRNRSSESVVDESGDLFHHNRGTSSVNNVNKRDFPEKSLVSSGRIAAGGISGWFPHGIAQ